MKRSHAVRTVALSLATALFASAAAQAAAPVTLKATGSTLMYPLISAWTQQYAGSSPNVHITVTPTGSGAGIARAIAGGVQFGASDAYMTDEQMTASPGMLNIPLAISSQLIAYNLPELKGKSLKLDGPTLAGIYTGAIHSWDDPAIAAMNAGLQLPHQAIVPIHRNDSSGDSFIFSQYLTFSTDAWEDGPSFGTDIAWPSVHGDKGATGNAGMVRALAATPYGIAYVGGSFTAQIAAAHLGTAMLKNQAGNFVPPTPRTVRLAAAELDSRTPKDERLSLVFAPGGESYPLVNYEYAIVAAKQSDPAAAAALRSFLLWAIDDRHGNEERVLFPLHFAALPDFVRALSVEQISKIR